MRIVALLAIAAGLSLGQISPPPTNAPSGNAGGNLSGTYPNPTVAKINGTTVAVNSAANQVALTTAAAVTVWTGIPSCQDTVGQHLNFNTTTHAFSCGTSLPTTAVTPGSYTNTSLTVDAQGRLTAAANGSGGTPASPANSVQFDNAGAFGGDTNLLWNNTTKALQIGQPEPDLSCCDGPATSLSTATNGQNQMNFLSAGGGARNSFNYYTSEGTLALPEDSFPNDYAKAEQYLDYHSAGYQYIGFHDVYRSVADDGGTMDWGVYDDAHAGMASYMALRLNSEFAIAKSDTITQIGFHVISLGEGELNNGTPGTLGILHLAKTIVDATGTTSNCSSSASPAVCASAAAGSVAIPTGTNPTLVVNTDKVTANSQILLQSDDTLGTKLSTTCNSTLASLAAGIVVTARTAGTSFTITFNGVLATNPLCLSYAIIN